MSLYTRATGLFGDGRLTWSVRRRIRRAARVRGDSDDYVDLGELERYILVPGWLIAFLILRKAYGISMPWLWAPFFVWMLIKLALYGILKARMRAGGSENALVRAMLKERHCPSCAYLLKGLPADPADGCTVCPECGGAWRLPGRETGATRPSG